MARHSKKKQITNFITTGQELEVYRNERDDNEDDDELDDLTERFANSSFIYDDGDLEENLERTVATCDEGYGEYFESNGCFANGDDQESFYPSAGDFYEEDYNLNAHCAINQPNSQFLFNSDQHNNFESQSSPEPTSSFYWTPSNEASCSFADQTQPFHESPIEEEKLTGLELVPYESEDDENDWPTNCRFNPEFDFDDDSQIKENLFGADQDDYHDDLLEIYKKEFRDNFPELFTKKKKRKEKKVDQLS